MESYETYASLNEIISLLKQINEKLTKIANNSY